MYGDCWYFLLTSISVPTWGRTLNLLSKTGHADGCNSSSADRWSGQEEAEEEKEEDAWPDLPLLDLQTLSVGSGI